MILKKNTNLIFLVSQKMKQFLNELDNVAISYLFDYSRNKELIKKTLLQNGVDYNLINNVINKCNTESEEQIPLIPDNYKEMLQEIKRIKQIML